MRQNLSASGPVPKLPELREDLPTYLHFRELGIGHRPEVQKSSILFSFFFLLLDAWFTGLSIVDRELDTKQQCQRYPFDNITDLLMRL